MTGLTMALCSMFLLASPGVRSAGTVAPGPPGVARPLEPTPNAPARLRYAIASSHLGAYDHSGRYGAPLLFDGDDRTAFCEGAPGPGVGERLVVEFDRPVRADRVRIAAGEPFEFGRFLPANRVRVLTIGNRRYEWQITLPDAATPFEMPLPPPITGQLLVIRIDAVHDHGARHTCLAELTFFESGRPVRAAPTVSGLPGPFAPTPEGVWAPEGDPSPERFLVFYRDGGFRQVLHANFAERPFAPQAGAWRLVPGPRGADATLTLQLRADDGPRSGALHFDATPTGQPRLRLDGALPGVYVPWVTP